MSTTDTRKWLGLRIEKLIRDKGMTKRAVSEKSGMPYSSLNSKLKGYRGFDLDDILAISEAIGEPPSSFLPPQFHASALAGKETE
ncbi:helix-turn-helix domain-containing protein [Bifidobacterium tissieri]|uniref:helix-turn-helix domain-containing protein n=1 Tax=Bifidobacterium tissieri TaxID=1630162 RepID=UPI0012388181|nr:helix-turn-helix transcriptional regulator [Bifidobacterium tissieri]KAA8831810.1 XRE family transcriptional regulator [Bifidobacterium tissieri]